MALKILLQKRSQVQDSLQDMGEYCNTFATKPITPEDIHIARARLESLTGLKENYNTVQSSIEAKKGYNEEERINRQTFDNLYFTIHGKLTSITTSSVDQSNPTTIPEKISPQFRLPHIEIPTFSGDYLQWVEFRDSFTSLIHNNSLIPDVQKLQYLRGVLKGEALDTIKALQITKDNYSKAWSTLQTRYQKGLFITQAHIKQILNHPTIKSESLKHLRSFTNIIINSLESLRSMDKPVDAWGELLVIIILDKLDTTTRKEWDKVSTVNGESALSDLVNFLNNQCEILEKHTQGLNVTSKHHHQVHVSQRSSCPFCHADHLLFSCKTFLTTPHHSKLKFLNKNQICINCLRSGHSVKECKSSHCKKCTQHHNTILHVDSKPTISNPSSPVNSQSLHSMHSSQDVTGVLSTALILVKSGSGTYHRCRALLDSGSTSNFISKALCEKLELKPQKIDCSVSGLGFITQNTQQQVQIHISSLNSSYQTNTTCLVLDAITNEVPITSFSRQNIRIANNYRLADPSFNVSSTIDILLGSSIFWECLGTRKFKLKNSNLIMTHSKLGWIVGGSIANMTQPTKNFTYFANTKNLNNALEKFWEVETVPESVSMTGDEQLCIEMFDQTTRRHVDGKFEVRLPFRLTNPKLGNSLGMAIRRLRNLEIKLAKNSELKVQYIEFLKEYEDLGHMTEVPEPLQDEECYYIPHHCVLKGDSQTTKLRVVFDASARSDNDMSLNEMLMVGPKMQDDLFDILIRFRQHQIAFTADIAKMYRQIWINQDDRKYQRIVWRENPEQKIKHYQLNTVTYGMASSSFLATKCIHQLAIENAKEFPVAAQHILKNFYVDDLLSGAGTPEEALKMIMEVSKMLDQAGFKLRKWASNCKAILSELSSQSQNEKHLLSEKEVSKTLGIFWDSRQDTLGFQIHCITDNAQKVTKRGILSMISKIFDPLGLIGPVTVKAKILIQALWKSKLDWDDRVDEGTLKEWKRFLIELEQLGKIQIGRKTVVSHPTRIELHGFCDASERAYGAAIFIKSMNDRNETSFKLLCAKSRVAPLKTISLPRLELCGASLLTKLMHSVSNILGVHIHRRVFWTDSQIALAWIKGEPGRWKTFVAHRVSHIQRFSDPGDWFHIRGSDNPADLLTRGVFPGTLVDNNLWWGGPESISQGDNWASAEAQAHISLDEIPEARKIAMAVVTNNTNNILSKFSNFTRMQRVIAYCLRFAKNCISKTEVRLSGPLELSEITNALQTIIRISQTIHFHQDITQIQQAQSLNKSSCLKALNPFIDSHDILRVGGRLQYSNIPYSQKHPIILHAKHHVTKLIFRYYHEQFFHCGKQQLLNSVRQNYWVIHGTSLAKQTIRTCKICFLVKPKPFEYVMGNLPEKRVNQAFPFQHVGIDFAGPFLIKDRSTRGAKLTKAYIALFICFITKAIHLELISDLTSENFLGTLKRFIGRRGKPSTIFSDNAKTFLGAKASLDDIHKFISDNKPKIHNYLVTNSIDWKFIPPRAPNFGGLWEAGVKSVKNHLKRVMGQSKLTFEQFSTLLCQIEGILNSRPLTILSNDPADLLPLTPGHFLIGRSPQTIPETSDLSKVPENRLKTYQILQQRIQNFWNRWHKEYLSTLQQRHKNQNNQNLSPHPGMVVVVKDESFGPGHWPLAVIQEVHPGNDGVARVATIRIKNSLLKRPITKLCPLPMND